LIDIIGSPSSNARAVYFAFLDMGIDCKIVQDATEINKSQKIVLPGVGAFGALSKFLHDSKLYELQKVPKCLEFALVCNY
jgi:imidazoleglycerol phosphate synthase glutamine amidotransferase subunit HisH